MTVNLFKSQLNPLVRAMAPPDAEGQFEAACAYWRSLRSDEGAVYDIDVQIDAWDIAPTVTWGTSPQDVAPITASVPAPRDFDGDEQRKAALLEFWSSSLPGLFKLMERVCEGASSGAIVGKTISYADVCMYVLANEYFDNRQGVQEALKYAYAPIGGPNSHGAGPARIRHRRRKRKIIANAAARSSTPRGTAGLPSGRRWIDPSDT